MRQAAQICAYYKLRFICVIDPKTTAQNISILNAFGATVDLVAEPDPETGEFLGRRIARVKELVREIPNSFWPNQYSNIANAEAHFETMGEITEALSGKVDYLFCAVSTCGTMSGCATYTTCVLILPDRGERYLDTIYSDVWVRNHFGEGALAEKDMAAERPYSRVSPRT